VAIKFAVSGQHYLFNVQAFAHTILALGGDEFEYALRDRTTKQVLADVASGASEIGIIVQTSDTSDGLNAAIEEAGLNYTALATSSPMVALGASHPLSNAKTLKLEQLEGWPYLCFEQEEGTPLAFAEEALAAVPRKKVIKLTDRASLSELATATNGYTITSGILVGITGEGSLITIPLETDVKLTLGYVSKKDTALSEIGQRFVKKLEKSLELYAK
jgi:DNA-binding transcriptional LysR family regulator